MNVQRGQTEFSPEENRALRQKLQEFKDYEALSHSDLAKRIGEPSGTLSQWLNDTYQGSEKRKNEIAYAVDRFFRAQEAAEALALVAPIVPGFLNTRTAARITSCLTWAKRGNFVLIVGTAGLGKTATIDQYENDNPNVFKVTLSPATRSVSPMLVQILHKLGSGRNAGSNQVLTQTILDRLSGLNALLVIDDAQHANDLALEQLRFIHDELKCGIALCGNPEVLTRIQGGSRAAAFAQLYSRVSWQLTQAKPHAEDIALLCNAWGVDHPKEREFLERIASQPGTLRNLTKTLEMATLLAQGDGEDRTLSHIQEAWAQRSQTAVAA